MSGGRIRRLILLIFNFEEEMVERIQLSLYERRWSATRLTAVIGVGEAGQQDHTLRPHVATLLCWTSKSPQVIKMAASQAKKGKKENL